MNEKHWQLIAERDRQGRDINQQFGIREPDGSYSSYKRSHTIPEYVSQFAKIERAFQPKYDAVIPDTLAANKAAGMTIAEYLLLEEVDDEQRFLSAATSGQYVDWIKLKAEAYIDKVRHQTFGEIARLIDLKKRHFAYAGTRCRKALDIAPWDVQAQLSILNFSNDFARQLQRAAANLTPR